MIVNTATMGWALNSADLLKGGEIPSWPSQYSGWAPGVRRVWTYLLDLGQFSKQCDHEGLFDYARSADNILREVIRETNEPDHRVACFWRGYANAARHLGTAYRYPDKEDVAGRERLAAEQLRAECHACWAVRQAGGPQSFQTILEGPWTAHLRPQPPPWGGGAFARQRGAFYNKEQAQEWLYTHHLLGEPVRSNWPLLLPVA